MADATTAFTIFRDDGTIFSDHENVGLRDSGE